jgi:hypothetical protein
MIKYILANLGINIVAIICIMIAGWLAFESKDGWGWFLFVGLLCSGWIKIQNDN